MSSMTQTHAILCLVTLLCSEVIAAKSPPQWVDKADLVLGQVGMQYPFANGVDGRGLLEPQSVAIDTSHKPYRIYVADTANHRVLAFPAPLAGNATCQANLVLGQPDLHSAYFDEEHADASKLLTPVSVAVDANGNLYVADRDYHRVVEFDRPFETDVIADSVFGQSNFATIEPNTGGISARALAHPCGVAVAKDGKGIWIADTGNSRVLYYRSPLTTDNIADFVLGQDSLKTGEENQRGISAKSLSGPTSVAVEQDYVVIADTGNSRVLIFNDPIHTDNTADIVLGQDNSFSTNHRGCSPYRMAFPTGVSMVSPRNSPPGILVCDRSNNRVLMFDLASGGTAQPIAIWGQGTNLHSSKQNADGFGPASLSSPSAITYAPDGTLWIADANNHRILAYSQGLTGDRNADYAIGQIDLHHTSPNLVDGHGLSCPRDVAIDRLPVPNRLYVCDSYNNRILGYHSTENLSTKTAPSIVLGQADLHSNASGSGSTSLSTPTSIAVDTNGGLFVADRDNNRVLWFANPFDTDTRPDRILGQPDFTTHTPNTGGISAKTLNRPEGVAVDKHGNLYIADTRNHRVLRFDQPITTDATADAVWGQHQRFTANLSNAGATTGPSTLYYPFGLAVNADGLLAVADTNNHRVLIFDTNSDSPFTAKWVFGQNHAMNSAIDNLGGCSPRSLSGPENVLFLDDNLLVADTANCRILGFVPFRTNDSASMILGQHGQFASKLRPMGTTSCRTLWFPSGMDLDRFGNLYVADREQNRVLIFHARNARTSAAPRQTPDN